MDSATEDIYLQKLQEFVYDEGKIVTPRWLSIILDISVNQSKKLLEKYVSDAKDTSCKDIAVTYLLSATTADNNLHVTIVKDDELGEKKTTFNNVIDEQIYSIQKCKDLHLNILSMVDYFDVQNPIEKPILGSITSKHCIRRILKTKKLPTSAPKPSVQSKPSMFSKVTPKPSTIEPVKEPVSKTKPSNGIIGFFSKTASQVNIKSEPITSDIKSEALTTSTNKNSLQNGINKLIDSESDSEQPVVKSQEVSKGSDNKKPRRTTKRSKKSNDAAPSPKRRKRIIEQESDSDDMFGSDTKEDINETVNGISEEETEIPISKVNIPLAPKNKKRKLVDRTCMHEDGYMVTTKEWVEESPSEDEILQEEIQKEEVKTEVKPNIKENKFTRSESNDFSDTSKENKTMSGKAKGGKKGKKALMTNQPTLMNFFKRA